MPLVDIDSAKNFLSSFENRSEREELFSIYERLPYQIINDSPTVKHYTRWENLDKLNLKVVEVKGKDITYPSISGYARIVVHNNIIREAPISFSQVLGNSLMKPEDHKLVALTLSLSRKMDIKQGGRYLIYHYTDEEGVFSPINIEINVPEGENADVIYYAENKGKSMNSAVISTIVGKDSSLNLTLLSKGNASYNFVYSKARVEGSINSYIISSGFLEGHVEYHSYLGEGAQAFFSSRALGVESNNIDVITNVYHDGPKSVSNGFMKSVSSGSSLVVTRGDARINEQAIDSSTSIIGRAIMLGESTAIVAPMLEVRTGRVITAKHSAAVSRVPEDLIFYLQNRGFDRKSAEGLIIRGFMEDEGDTEIVKKLISDIITSLGY
ncbi:SufD family Fe-S cluster assembly protein [Acidianus sp. HS-5]|uniref:SufD family Fe-S cluster assembly protein n=1 Tax=Acidianus sp. HS-5 TaxID=2886040 RepID=UPI001F02FB1D|nr:SufD family Fe-S cluster assembly protein [Acidianus sp. HS-5]BDC19840.1 hypothetical protein HS5_27300 [Acidianus sp. HS-5]